MKQAIFLVLSAPLLAFAKPILQHLHLHDKRAIVTRTVHVKTTTTVDVVVTIFGAPPTNKQPDVAQHKPNGNDAKPTSVAESNDKPKYNPLPSLPVNNQVKAAAHPDTKPPAQPTKEKPTKEDRPQPQSSPVVPSNEPVVSEHVTPQHDSHDGQSQGHGQDQGKGQHSGAPSGGSCGEIGGKCLASDVTIYNDQGTGACGWANDTNTEDYFALAANTFGVYTNDAPGNNKNKFCGRTAMISVNGRTFECTLTDKCPGCTGWSIDLSQSLWNKVFNGEAHTRKKNIEWWFTGPEIYHGPGN